MMDHNRHKGQGVTITTQFKPDNKKFNERNWKMAIVPDDNPRKKYTLEQRQIIDREVQKLQQEVIKRMNISAPYSCIVHDNTNFIFCKGRLLQLELNTVVSRLNALENFPKARLITKKEFEHFSKSRGPWMVLAANEFTLAIVAEGYPVQLMTLSDNQFLANSISNGPVQNANYTGRFEHSVYFVKCADLVSKERLRAFVSTLNIKGVRFVGLNDDHIAVNLGKAFHCRNATKNFKGNFDTTFSPKIAVVSKEFPQVAVRQRHLKDLNRKAQQAIPKVNFVREDTLLAALFVCENEYAIDWIKRYISQASKGLHDTIEIKDLERHMVLHTGIVTYNGPEADYGASGFAEVNTAKSYVPADAFIENPNDRYGYTQGSASTSRAPNYNSALQSPSCSEGRSDFACTPNPNVQNYSSAEYMHSQLPAYNENRQDFDFKPGCNSYDDIQNHSERRSNFTATPESAFEMTVVPKGYPQVKLIVPQYSMFKTEMEKCCQSVRDAKFHNVYLKDGAIFVVCENGSSLNQLHNIVEVLNSYGNIPILVVENLSCFAAMY